MPMYCLFEIVLAFHAFQQYELVSHHHISSVMDTYSWTQGFVFDPGCGAYFSIEAKSKAPVYIAMLAHFNEPQVVKIFGPS